MSKAVALQHVAHEGPGRILPVFRDFGIPVEVRHVYKGDEVPTDLDEVRDMIAAVRAVGDPGLVVLQCTAKYPAPLGALNVRTVATMTALGVLTGLSDHSREPLPGPLAAVALGGVVIEKHFTLNRAWKGTDHAFSLEPVGLRKLVRDLKRTRVTWGDGVKKVYPSEQAPLSKMSKAIVAARPLPAGHILTADDVAFKSPGGGLHPYQVDLVVGMRTTVPLQEDEVIRLGVLVPAVGTARVA